MIRYGAVLLFTLVFSVLAGLNGWTVVNFVRTRRHVSAIPLLGGLSGMAATQFVERLQAFWWLPLLLDYGSAPMMLYFVVDRFAAARRGE